MEVFKAIIELIDKIIWPVVILTMFLCLKTTMVKLINSIPYILKERGGEIKTPWMEVILHGPIEKAKSAMEIKQEIESERGET